MSANTTQRDLAVGTGRITDPGASGTIRIGERGYGICVLKSAAAETRTLAAPGIVGQRIVVTMDTDGGDITLSFATGAQGSSASSSYTFDAVGDTAMFVAGTEASVLKWQLIKAP